MPTSKPETLKILLADDCEFFSSMAKLELARFGFKNTVTAPDGTEALFLLKKAALENAPFHIVISDWVMPRLSGVLLYEEIRRDSDLKHLPFVMLTALENVEALRKATKLGITEYIVKPTTTEQIAAKIKSIFSIRAQ